MNILLHLLQNSFCWQKKENIPTQIDTIMLTRSLNTNMASEKRTHNGSFFSKHLTFLLNHIPCNLFKYFCSIISFFIWRWSLSDWNRRKGEYKVVSYLGNHCVIMLILLRYDEVAIHLHLIIYYFFISTDITSISFL